MDKYNITVTNNPTGLGCSYTTTIQDWTTTTKDILASSEVFEKRNCQECNNTFAAVGVFAWDVYCDKCSPDQYIIDENGHTRPKLRLIQGGKK